MLCQNCGKREANFHYTQIINGEKKEIKLCSKCAKEMGIDDFEIPMTLDFSNLFGDFLHQYEEGNTLGNLMSPRELMCPTCHMTYDELLNTGRFGCADCYNTFRAQISPILKSLHGNDTHIGRIGKVSKGKVKLARKEKQQEEQSEKESTLTRKQQELKQAIKEERYEDAALLRDEIKKLEDEKK